MGHSWRAPKPVGPDDQVGVNICHSLRRVRSHADDPSGVFEHIDYFGSHLQFEVPIAPGVLGEELQKIPLRHQSNEFAMSG